MMVTVTSIVNGAPATIPNELIKGLGDLKEVKWRPYETATLLRSPRILKEVVEN